jgi:nicotinamidase-related amidase
MTLAFFDSCGHHPDETSSRFVLAEKMAPVRKSIRRILHAARCLGAPVLSTACLGIQRCTPGMCVRSACAASNADGPGAFAGHGEGKAFVAMNATQAELAAALRCREIVFERTSCKSGDENVRLRTFDVFGVNRNAAAIARSFGDRHWLVFGAGFEHCLISAVEGLRTLGVRVTVLEDACIHGGRSIPATFLRTFERIRTVGAEWRSFDAVCDEYGFDDSIRREPPRAAPRNAASVGADLAAAIEAS